MLNIYDVISKCVSLIVMRLFDEERAIIFSFRKLLKKESGVG